MDVSIIIVNYNTKDFIINCIDSIVAKTVDIAYEIIVVDNGSVDGSVEALSLDPRIKFYATGENLGFGKGNNYGFRHATGKYIFLLNSDTVLINNAIKIFFDFFEQHSKENVGVLGAVLKNHTMTDTLSFVPFKSVSILISRSWSKLKQKIFKSEEGITNYDFKDLLEVDAVLGADMFMPYFLYERLNGFDENFFLYGEEVEFQKRIQQEGYRRLIIKGPEIVHFEGGSSDNKGKKLSYRTIFNLQKGELFYVRKHFRISYYYFYKLLLGLTWLPWVVIDKRFNKTQKIRLLQLLINPEFARCE